MADACKGEAMNNRIIALSAGLGIVLIAAVTLIDPKPKLIWNATASAPMGLYWAEPLNNLKLETLLIIKPPRNVAYFMDARGYLPLGAVLLKRVVAIEGTEICRKSDQIFVAGKEIAQAKRIDGKGRLLPYWQGCRRLHSEEVFLVNSNVQDSLDGRYFGPLPKSSIIGLAYPIWIDEESDGRN